MFDVLLTYILGWFPKTLLLACEQDTTVPLNIFISIVERLGDLDLRMLAYEKRQEGDTGTVFSEAY